MGSGANGVERFRIVLSDVKNYIQSMLATQLNHVVKEDKLKRGSFLRLKQFQQQEVKGKRCVLVPPAKCTRDQRLTRPGS